MKNYIEILVESVEPGLKEILIAQLSDLNFEGFEESETGLKAFIPEHEFKTEVVSNLICRHNLNYSSSVIPPQNWNALWESNFEPVIVEDFCEVRADFHLPSNSTKFEIIITPKMSFGTGHHATTYMMIQQMRDIDFKRKVVADFGTGTGILSIFAEKLGSQKIFAIDCDDWSIQNAEENIERNCCNAIELHKTETFSPLQKVDIILANINKNVIIENLDGLIFGLNPKGFLLISGILKGDENDLINACTDLHLSYIKTIERSNWISMLFQQR